MSKNKSENLRRAKKEKNDEFYTQYSDIKEELQHYIQNFENKIVYCNCDDPSWSNFWKYFYDNFEKLKLKRIISTYYNKDGKSKVTTYDGVVKTERELDGNGDFRNIECIEILKNADIIVTNPPFSLFREYVAQLVEYNKEFLIIGNKNAITYKEIFPLLKNNEIWLGYNNVKEFIQPDTDVKKKMNGLTRWFTNLEHNKRYEKLYLVEKYDPKKYPKYDNYDAIEVNKVSNIPVDYNGIMGVPITFLDKHNPEQFEILGLDRYTVSKDVLVGGRLAINGKPKYARILIRRKDVV